MGTVYLLCLDRPLAKSKRGNRHYIGWSDAENANARINAHRAGRGSVFMAQARREGIGFRVAMVWVEQTQDMERRLKRQRHHRRYCGYCTGDVPRALPTERPVAARRAVVGVDMATGTDQTVTVTYGPLSIGAGLDRSTYDNYVPPTGRAYIMNPERPIYDPMPLPWSRDRDGDANTRTHALDCHPAGPCPGCRCWCHSEPITDLADLPF